MNAKILEVFEVNDVEYRKVRIRNDVFYFARYEGLITYIVKEEYDIQRKVYEKKEKKG